MNEQGPFHKKHVSSHFCLNGEKKPIEIYMFVDPLSPECWALEPITKKLQIEYGRYFSIKHVLSGRLATLNLGKKRNNQTIADLWEKTASRSGMSCDGSLWLENPISSPYLTSIAIKAAELQGRKYGMRYLRKIQELLFLEKQDVSDFSVLIQCANSVKLDVDEFVNDIHSDIASKAFQCDLKIMAEMDVQEIPTLVFFNENIEEEGIKITGYYPYEIYVQILEEMLQHKPLPAAPPSLESFVRYFKLVAAKEIAVVYNMTLLEVNREMKKMQLKQIVEQVPAKYGIFWRAIEE
ncbi:ClpXP adapter SpxH family protein [Bacillus sp. T3]|uniref:ClpXP adapter SpxH family protein n=1 Tax=Bacillus sp. T3 TaxID=467262 RepID=UPI002982A3E3|nr:ClpXP adapter SpxH family protein [Bacillus sp. T3]